MSLKTQLRKGLLAILVVIVIFIIMTSKSYLDLDGFVNHKLPINISLARQYEKVVGRWNLLSEQAQLLVKESDTDPNFNLWQTELENSLNFIEESVKEEKHKNNAKTIRHIYSSFTRQFASLERLIINRNDIVNKNTAKKINAAKNARTEIEALLKSFKSMIKDLQTTIKSPDFKASLAGTNSLYDKILRIENDLQISETELSLYLNQSSNSNANQAKKVRKASATRVEERLRAIRYLIERSTNESNNPLHKRILNKIGTSVKNFSSAFANLRNTLEASNSDILGLEDQIQNVANSIEELKQQGIAQATVEAEYFWEKIDNVSVEQIKNAHDTYNFIAVFLIFVFIAGIYMMIHLPRKINGPLKDLGNKISNFTLGSKAPTLPPSEILEIDTLRKSFEEMAKGLHHQGEMNRDYLIYIHLFTSIFSDLHETAERVDTPEERKETAINKILNELLEKCPKIDLVKVMEVKYKTSESSDSDSKKKNHKSSNAIQIGTSNGENVGERVFCRLGDPIYSEEFKKSDEFIQYCDSTGFNEDATTQLPEILPIDESSLSGWLYENNLGINAAVDDDNFFQEIYSPFKINENALLKVREREKGLNGCAIAEPLILPGENNDDENRNHGLLLVYFNNPKVKLSWQEISFIQIIASHVAFIIETDELLKDHDAKKLIDNQMEMARGIQENLLPRRIPKIQGLQIDRFNQQAAEVGGDYYDFFKLDKERVGIVIADASGKNVTGAILMTVFKTALSTMDLSTMSASEVLSKANNIIASNITEDKFITAMYIIVNSKTGEVELASAGHNPAFIGSNYGKNFCLSEKNTKGLPLGILEDYPYTSINFTMKKKDLLVMYTDGVTEARNTDGEEYGEQKLKAFMARPHGKTPAQELIDEVKDFYEPAKPHDDITAVTVQMV